MASGSIEEPVNKTESTTVNSIDMLGMHLEAGDYSVIAWLFVAYMVFKIIMPILDAWKAKKLKELDVNQAKAKESNIGDIEQSQRELLEVAKDLRKELFEKNSGVKSREEAVDFFREHHQKNHLEIIVMLLTRIIENNVKTETSLISDKWTELSDKLSFKAIERLSKATYEGRSLSDFWELRGAKQYYLYICSEMFAIQYSSYMANESINRGRLIRALDVNLNRLTLEFNRYLDTGKTFVNQWSNTKPQYSLTTPFELDKDTIINKKS